MKIEQILIGDIKKCTRYKEHTTFSINTGDIIDRIGYTETEGEVYKKDAVILKMNNGGYIDIDNYNTIGKLRILTSRSKLGGLVLSKFASYEGCLYIDNLKPYFNDQLQVNKILVKQLKKQRKLNNNK